MKMFKDYHIEAISNKLAMQVAIEKHYLHRKGPCSVAFGLFQQSKLMGIVAYGTPSSPPP